MVWLLVSPVHRLLVSIVGSSDAAGAGGMVADRRTINQRNKAVVWDYWQRMNYARPDQIASVIEKTYHRDVNWNASQPINQIRGTSNLVTQFWEPFIHSFPNIRRSTDILMGGFSRDEEWVAGMGYLTGTFANDWLGIPATGRKTNIRFDEFMQLQDEKIVASYVIFDVLAVMKQAGFQVLPPALGTEGGKLQRPFGSNGVLLTEQDAFETRKTMQIVAAMWDGMGRYERSRDGGDLNSMQQEHYWAPGFHWYGPTGIGSCHSLEEYQDFHQRPWLAAFGDRNSSRDFEPQGGRSLGHISEGQFGAAGIWDFKFSSHHGEYLGVPATGKNLTLRNYDWYIREGDDLVQNWAPIDMIDLFMQMDVDLFDRMRRQLELRMRGERWYAPGD